VLSANVVTSTHTKSDTALIDKIFVNKAQINRLTAKQAFISNIKAIDISADKITSGTLNAAKARIINLDFDTAVGNRTQFIRSAWETASGGSVTIRGNGINSTADDGSQVYIQDGVVEERRPKVSGIAHIGSHSETNRTCYTIDTTV